MRGILFLTVLSLNVTLLLGDPKPNIKVNNTPQKLGSHNLLKTDSTNNSANRPVRCTPCGGDATDRKPISNHLNPEYRGNGADNLGYDWSPMAWGGLAFPHRPKMFMGGMRGRDGRMMPGEWNRNQNQGSVHIICDTCRTYYEGDSGSGSGDRGIGRGNNRGRQYPLPGGQGIYGGQQGNWQDGRASGPQDFETRVSSPAVGVLVKPGSSIAYVPSRSGEMYWDGVSGGGTRWDGFSNGISWVGNGSPEWDRMDTSSKEEKPASSRPGEFSYDSNSFRPWDQKGSPGWNDNNRREYYFANGSPNQLNPQWADRGYASNWDYGSTNQFGWNGNNMKWNYGGKWDDNDRAANRFYFNSPQDRTYGPSGGNQFQYGYQYPNYQSSGQYPGNFRPRPMWKPDGGYRVNDRDPSNFPTGSYGSDKNRPWDYNSRNPSGYRRPGSRPEWLRPGPYPSPGDFDKGDSGSQGGGKYPASDKNDYGKPWNSPGYGPSKPDSGNNYPYGGNRYPGEEGRPGFSPGNNNLFYPNDGSEQPTYPNIGGGSVRPTYPSSGNRPGGNYLGGDERPSTGYPGGRPGIVYTGGRPPMGGSTYPNSETTTGYPGGSSTTGGYPNAVVRPSGYPSGGSSSAGYPGGGNRPSPDGFSSGGRPSAGYPGDAGAYPGGGGSSGRYPNNGRPSGGYPSGGGPSGGYPIGGGPSGGYPSGGGPSGGYPSGGGPSGGYPSGGRYPGGGSRPGPYPDRMPSYPSGINRPEEYPSGGSSRPGIYPSYPGGGSSYPRPDSGYPTESYRPYPGNEGSGYPGGYPSGDRYGGGSRPSGYPSGGRPEDYPGGGSRPSYPVRGPGGYPGPRPGGLYQGGKNPPKGYYTGYITEIGGGEGRPSYGGGYPNYFGGSYPGDKNSYPEKDKNRYPYGGSNTNRYPDEDKYPSYADDRYSGGGGGGSGGGGGGGGGSYPVVDRDRYPDYDRGGDKYYYGQSNDRGKYPGGYPSNHRYPNRGSGSDFEGSSGSDGDKNWNYGQDDRKDGSIYRRSGGSYPPYRGGQYFTSSYLASMSTTSGSTQEGSETKTQSVTKADEVTQPTPS